MRIMTDKDLEARICDSTGLNATTVGENKWDINLSNGKTIHVEANVSHNGTCWPWLIDSQYFGNAAYAYKYLRQIIAEKLTGIRVLFRAKGTVPDICGVGGAGCRAKGKCNTGLCNSCPIADRFFADRDGVDIVYAIGEDSNKCNTLISYLYRDASNYKVHNTCVLRGEMTDEQNERIKSVLIDGEFFYPSQFGLPEEKFGDVTADDVDFFEWQGFELVDAPATVDMTPEQLVEAMEADFHERIDCDLTADT